VAPDVLLRKLAYLRQLLRDLTPYRGATLEQVEAEHYKLERLFELLATAAGDLLFHLLAQRGVTPGSYREAFKAGADEGLIPAELAEKLQSAAGMRNVLAHLYETIDYAILRDSIEPALRDFGQLVAIFAAGLDEEE
jgi:uncharacterized protein YutE (UPF0331/DUF86 family)